MQRKKTTFRAFKDTTEGVERFDTYRHPDVPHLLEYNTFSDILMLELVMVEFTRETGYELLE